MYFVKYLYIYWFGQLHILFGDVTDLPTNGWEGKMKPIPFFTGELGWRGWVLRSSISCFYHISLVFLSNPNIFYRPIFKCFPALPSNSIPGTQNDSFIFWHSKIENNLIDLCLPQVFSNGLLNFILIYLCTAPYKNENK